MRFDLNISAYSMAKTLLYSFLIIALLVGCGKEDLTPSFLKINAFELITNEPTQGSNSHGITDAWIFMDGEALGVHELPCVIPVLAEGTHQFIIFPGIKNNGISSTRTRYPFYKTFDITADLTKNDTTEFSPVTYYKDNVTFAFMEDFEDAGISLIKGPTSDTNMIFVDRADYPEIVIYGDQCGGLFLNAEDSIYTGSTQSFMNLPKGEQIFLEIDYRNNNSLAMGVIATFYDGTTDEHTPLVIMNPQDEGQEEWKKIYIELSEDVGVEINATTFEFYFLAMLDADKSLAKIYIDNIKVVHFQ